MTNLVGIVMTASNISKSTSVQQYQEWTLQLYVINCLLFISDNLQKHRFITSYTPKVIIPAIKVNRSNIFRETLDLYTNIPNLVHQLPLKVSFRGEKAVDTGGVGREFFSCFWEEAYKEAFVCASLLTLAVHAHVDCASLPQLGKFCHMDTFLVDLCPFEQLFPHQLHVFSGQQLLYLCI